MKRKPLNNRFLSAVLGFSFALALVPYMISSASISVSAESVPAEVQAFMDTLQDWADNAEAIVNLDADIDYYLPLGFVSAYLQNVRDAYAADKEIDLTLVQGQCYYRLVGSSIIYPCSCYAVATSSGVLAASQHFRISYEFEALSTGADLNMYAQFNMPYYQVGGSASSGRVFAQWRDDLGFFTGTPSAQERAPYGVQIAAEVRNEIPTLSSGYSLGTVVLVGGLNTAIDFPTGTASKASPWEYYNNVLVPYLQTEFPDTPTTLMPEPYNEPETPIYPTDFVTGIPKDWTIENPQLPTAPDIEFNDYAYDFSDLQPVDGLKSISDVVRGINFWWWLTEKTLDSLSIKVFYIIFLSLAVLCFVVWYLGN